MHISQGEIWMVSFSPKVGSEITKLRPAVVVSHNTIGKLPLKTIVPITDWKPNYANYPWMLPINPNDTNGLLKVSAIDCFQVKNFANERFDKKIGSVNSRTLRKIHAVIIKTLDPMYMLS